MNIYTYLIPKNLDVKSIRDALRIEYAEKLLFYISTVILRQLFTGAEPDEFVNLKAQYLGSCIRNSDVGRVKRDLLKRGIIETDFKYNVGKKAFGFRLAEQYQGQETYPVPARYPKVKKYEPKSDLLPAEAWIDLHVRRVTIEPESLPFLEAYREERKAELEDLNSLLVIKAKDYQKKHAEIINSYNYGLASIKAIQDKNWFFERGKELGKRTGRVYHNISNLNKELRPFLRLDGRELAEVDISNCQPMLLHCIYENREGAEAVNYKELVESGGFYEALMDETGFERDTVKEQFMFLFGKKKHENEVTDALFNLFPELAAIVAKIKNPNHNALALKLQKLEADLIIRTVVPLCQNAKIPVLTVHDSILTFPEFRDEVAGMIKGECERLYGLVPTLKAH